MNAIELEGLTKRYKKGVVAVEDARFTVPQGTAFGLLGPIGAGKSSIINMLVNFIQPSAGTIKILDREIPAQWHEVQHRIGYLPERPGFYGNFSAEKNLRFLANISNVREEREEKIKKLFKLAGLEGNETTLVRTFSLSDRKRLGIAAAMLNEPELLILDEPSTGLDPQGRRDIMALVHELNVHDVTLFLATHNVRDIAEICDEVATMKTGHVAAPTTAKEFVADVRGNTVEIEADVADVNERVLQAIRSVKGVKSIQCEGLKISLEYRPGINEDVNYVITRAGGRLRSLRESPSLEEAYVRRMGGKTR
ncbi:MAG TPA: ABC transporter ATP-binding protein [Candidatus Bathyarchaeia archaeon]|nr:ABC transporter ATP-binding protein [Candidatus Bathyarchaeia archaeon]